MSVQKDQFKYDEGKDVYICPEGKELSKIRRAPEIFVRKSGAIATATRYQCYDCQNCRAKIICCNGKSARSIRRYGDEVLRQEMAKRIRSKKGYALYKQRFKVAEPIFGNIKHNIGFRKFSLRGLIKTRGEFFLITMVHNLAKIHNYLRENKIAIKNTELAYQMA